MVEEVSDVVPVAGRTTSAEVDRILTVVWPILLWLVCGWLLREVDAPYFQGMADGVFGLLTARAAVLLGRHYAARGGDDLDQARGGVLVGLCVVTAVVAAAGVVFFWR